ncbi:hypothetical protein ACFYNX_27285 [Streptomyces sp. NPDC007872]|uniref:hypothetical protein n=1 Tax=Streptomyces sp. NPDC007872 TaxID=3364782 RepID=UPI003691D435
MSDNNASDRIVGEHTIHGHHVEVHRLTWKNHPSLSFDVTDTETGGLLNMDESFDHYPTTRQLTTLIEASDSEDRHDNCFGAHVTADGHADCDGNVL